MSVDANEMKPGELGCFIDYRAAIPGLAKLVEPGLVVEHLFLDCLLERFELS